MALLTSFGLSINLDMFMMLAGDWWECWISLVLLLLFLKCTSILPIGNYEKMSGSGYLSSGGYQIVYATVVAVLYSKPMIDEDISRLEQECQRLRASMSSTRK